jgi:hypothetical protein
MSDKPIQLDEGRLSMKPLLGALVKEAVKLALIDSVMPTEREPNGQTRLPTDEEQRRWREDIHSIPAAYIANMDPLALAQNVACRLLGTGGWSVNGVYGGNASPRDLLDATFERPDQRYVDEFAFDLLRVIGGRDDD